MVGLKHTLWCIYRKFPINMSPLSECLLPFSTPCSCVNEHLLGMLLWAFSFSSVVDCVQKHVHTKYMYYSLVCWPPPRFTLLATWTYSRWFPVTTDNANCSDLSSGNTRVPVPLISCSAHSSKLPSWLSTPSIDCKKQRKGCMHRTNRLFEQTPLCLKVMCRKGRHTCMSLWHIYMISSGMLVTTFLHTHTHK